MITVYGNIRTLHYIGSFVYLSISVCIVGTEQKFVQGCVMRQRFLGQVGS